MVIFYKRSLKERDNESYAEAIKYRIEKLGIRAETAGDGIDCVLKAPSVADSMVAASASGSVDNVRAGDIQYRRTEDRKMILTDTKDTFIKDFLIDSKYIVIIVTPGLLLDFTALFELDLMKKLFTENKVKIFTVFKNVAPNELPDRVSWIRLSKYNEPEGISDIYTVAVAVAAEYWRDKLGESQYDTVDGYLRNRNFYNDRFLKEISCIYRGLEKYDVRAKILVLVIINGYMVIKSRRLKVCTNNQECICGIAELVYQGRALTQSELEIINCCILNMLQSNENLT